MVSKKEMIQSLLEEVRQYLKRVKGGREEGNEWEIRDALRRLFESLLGDKLEYKDLPEIEKKLTLRGFYVGRADITLDGVLVEVKSKLTAPKKKEALEQAKKYLNSDQLRHVPFCIITDGLQFEVYEREDLTRPIDSFSFPEVEDQQEYIRILGKLGKYVLLDEKVPLNTQSVLDIAGYDSILYRTVHRKLVKLYENLKEDKDTSLKFSKWKLYLSFVYGNELEEDLFFRHTYLSLFVKLLVMKILGFRQEHDLLNVISGKFFKGAGIRNYVEEDFYTWVLKEEIRDGFEDVLENISSVLDRKFSFEGLSEELEEDLLKELYQNIVSKRERQLLGEYYTPDWLVQKIIQEVLTDPNARILDPSCGSGSFLFFAIKRKKELLKELNPKEKLRQILQTVVGIDVNPIATFITKTNYLLALGELIKEKRDFEIEIPVYTADSLRSSIFYNRDIYKGDTIELNLNGNKLSIPYYKNDASLTDKSVDAIVEYALSKHADFRTFVQMKYPELLDVKNFETLEGSAETLKKIVKDKGNGIWGFILKNVHRPLFLQSQPFDLVVGNPPWISFNRMNTNMQRFVEEFIKSYRIRVSAHTKTSFELATVFLVVCARDYLKENGKIAFVLPYSLLTGDQNQWIRRWITLGRLGMHPLVVYDLKEVSPLFNQASCVLVVEKRKYRSFPKSIPSLVFSGEPPRRNASLAEAEERLQVKSKILYITGEAEYWSYEKDMAMNLSYLDKFTQGATIVPRSFWFIERLEVPMGQFFTEGIYVRSKIEGDEKLTVELRGHLPERFFFKTLLSKRMYPFGWTQLDEVFLPLKVKDGKYELLDYYKHMPIEEEKGDIPIEEEKDAKKVFLNWLEKSTELTDNMKDWLLKAQKTWEEWRGDKAKEHNILDWLDYRCKLTTQPVEGGYFVLYTTSGANPCACVIEKDERFIADTTTYYALMHSEEEALYVASLLNSSILANMISHSQAHGAFGERHIHTLPLQYIPSFDQKNPLHLELVEVAKKAHEKAGRPEIKEWLKGVHFNRIRTLGRYILYFELNKIDAIVAKLLGKEEPPQAIGVALFTDEEDQKELRKIVYMFLPNLKPIFLPPQVLLAKYSPLESSEEILKFAKSGIDFVRNLPKMADFMTLLKALKERGIKAVLIRREGNKTTEEVV